MDGHEKQIVQENFPYLVSECKADELLDYLFSKSAIDSDDYQKVYKGLAVTDSDKMRELLWILLKKTRRKHGDVFQALLDALKKAKREDVAEVLTKCYESTKSSLSNKEQTVNSQTILSDNKGCNVEGMDVAGYISNDITCDMDKNSVKVSNLPHDIREEELDLYFSNDKYGGGDVKQITLNTVQSTAIIEFIADKVVSNVLGKCPHTLKGKQIDVEKYSPASDKIQSDHNNNVVMVTNLPTDVSDEYLKLYFERTQKSGGGDIDKLERLSDGTVLLTFVDDKDAERVISRGIHTIRKTKVAVSKWVETPLKTIRVTGFKVSTSDELLCLFFGNKSKSGGGKVESLHRIQNGVTLVTFEEEKDCKEVLARQGLVLTGSELTVTPWRQKPVEFKSVIVSGLAPDEEMIRLFFENSGGGDIESVDRRRNSKTVSIKFRDELVAKHVVEVVMSEGLHLNGAKLNVVLDRQHTNSTSEATGNISGDYIPDTIEVSGPIKTLSQAAILYYFENTIRSGGGEISDMTQQNEDTIHITFKDAKVLDAVLSKTHRVNGVKLTVTVYIPTKPKLMDPTKLFVANISPYTLDNTLTMLFEHHCGQVPTKIVHGETGGTMMILFKDKVDVAALQDIFKTEPLDEQLLTVEPVPLGYCIRVSGFKDKTKDALKLYFASQKRSDGGEINEVRLFKKEGYALVDFKDYKVADRVLQKKHHFEGLSLTLCTHYDCIGLVSIDGIASITHSGTHYTISRS